MNPENIVRICIVNLREPDSSDRKDLIDTLQGWWFQEAAMRGMTPIQFSRFMMEQDKNAST